MNKGRFALLYALAISGIVAAVTYSIATAEEPQIVAAAGEAGLTSVTFGYDSNRYSLDELIAEWEAEIPGYTVTSCRREPMPMPMAQWECSVLPLI